MSLIVLLSCFETTIRDSHQQNNIYHCYHHYENAQYYVLNTYGLKKLRSVC